MSSKDANLYIHDSAAGGYPILISDDDKQPTLRMKYGLESIRKKNSKQFL
jgi:hypothetical protein